MSFDSAPNILPRPIRIAFLTFTSCTTSKQGLVSIPTAHSPLHVYRYLTAEDIVQSLGSLKQPSKLRIVNNLWLQPHSPIFALMDEDVQVLDIPQSSPPKASSIRRKSPNFQASRFQLSGGVKSPLQSPSVSAFMTCPGVAHLRHLNLLCRPRPPLLQHLFAGLSARVPCLRSEIYF